MSSRIADDAEAIARRLKELQAERDQALTGSSAEVTGKETKTESHMYGSYGDYAG